MKRIQRGEIMLAMVAVMVVIALLARGHMGMMGMSHDDDRQRTSVDAERAAKVHDPAASAPAAPAGHSH